MIAAAADATIAGTGPGAIELVFLLLFAATGLAVVARKLGIPYPILLVIGGVLLGLVPALPSVTLAPEIVFLLFLPPILFGAGYFTSIRDLKANLRAVGLLAVGLVLFTTTAVAIVAHALIPSLPWAAAFALGAIVSPPDAVAATAVFQRLGVPRRAVTILEGESLLNDATALVAFRFAVAAALGGTFSLAGATIDFVYVGVVGTAVGIATGLLVAFAVRRLDDPVFSVVITFLAPASIYAAAEFIGASGVLAVVGAGIVVGQLAPRSQSSEVRLSGQAAWQVLVFLINGAVFILIGLQLRGVVAGLGGRSAAELIELAVAVSVTVIVARIVWVFPGAYLPRRLSRRIREREPDPTSRNVFLVSWAGMRGVVSLAAALSLPLTLNGQPFPERNLLIFLAFAVILATLVGQGLTLPLVIRKLGIVPDGDGGHEEAHVRLAAAEAAVARIEELSREWPDHLPLIDSLRAQYQHRAEHLDEVHHPGPETEAEQELLEHRQIRLAVIEAERETILRMRDGGAVNDEVFRAVERDLDLEELRMEA
ncbi:MAG TPA: Na+/H+ antiporter [Candidatus Limnocylindrales bacterium]|nr:Na+/H+ antiporter [Candidatus Limnocylindrales bacterium]